MWKSCFSILSLVLVLLSGNVQCREDIDDKSSITQVSYKKPSSNVELLLEDLLHQKWDEDEQPCYDRILDILLNVRNSTLWAIWIWDSIQLPTGQFYGSLIHLGNFDQCLRKVWSDGQPIATQYCLVDLELADIEPGRKLSDVNPYDTAESYFRIKTKFGYKFNAMSWGVCVPAVCQTQSVDRFTRALFRLSHFGAMNIQADVKVQHCQVSRTPPGSSSGLNIILLSAVLLFTMVCGCTYCTKKYRESNSNNTALKIVSAFDLNRNAADLMTITKEEIKVINGIRFLTACLIVILHMIFVIIMSSSANGLDLNDDFNRFADFLPHCSIVVDTYLMMSGLLLMKSFKPETGRPINPFKLILKRYFRLLWVYIIAILLFMAASPYIYAGPLWPKIAINEREPCEKNWLTGLLMLGNYVDSANICLPITWYVPVDYHVTVLSIMMYWLYQKNRRVGLYVFGFITIVSLLLPGLETYLNMSNPVTVFDFESIRNYREMITSTTMYVHSHMRATPYFVGVVAGYVLSAYKPANYRNVISTRYSILAFVGIVALSASALVFGSGIHLRAHGAAEAAIFAAGNRTTWAALMAAFILLCEYGNLPVVTDFLSWSGFVPVSRLSYGLYMLHYIFVLRQIFITRNPPSHDLFKLISDSMGIIVITTLISLYILLFVESPLNKLVELALKTKTDGDKLSAMKKKL